jgi:hypothetical protein
MDCMIVLHITSNDTSFAPQADSHLNDAEYSFSLAAASLAEHASATTDPASERRNTKRSRPVQQTVSFLE